MRQPAPVITDAEVRHATLLFKQRQAGLTRKELETAFGSDRRARLIIAHLVTKRIAPIVKVEDGLRGNVYRLARNEEEKAAEARSLRSYATQLLARAEGLEAMTAGTSQEPQGALF